MNFQHLLFPCLGRLPAGRVFLAAALSAYGVQAYAASADVTAVADVTDVQGDTANKVGAILAKYPKGKIDAIWGAWDAFSQGAYKALKENGRTEIKLYSIDISNQDLQLMREPGSPWKVSVAVDPKLIGATNVRLIANKIAGEATPATYDVKAAAIPQGLLTAQPGGVNVASLGKIIPGWGQTEDFIAPWFATLEAKSK